MLSIGMNKKLKAGNIVAYNITAKREVCGRDCPRCYAKKSQACYPAVLPFRERNLAASRLPTFVADTAAEIGCLRRKPAAVRVHEAGEYYDQVYLDKWVSIATQCPDNLFYTYTKRIKELGFSQMLALPNFIVVDSCKYGAFNYGPPALVAEWSAKGAFICPADKTVSCNNGCNYCLTKVAQSSGVVFFKH